MFLELQNLVIQNSNLQHLLREGERVGYVGQRQVSGYRRIIGGLGAAAMGVTASKNKNEN